MSRGHAGMRGQTSMVLIVLIIVIFAILAVFLLSMANTVSQEDYMDLYVNNLMLSVMRTDTGCSDSNCKLVSDTVACAFTLSDWPCGDTGKTCLELSNESLSDYMDAFETISKNYRYLFVVTSESCSLTDEGCRALEFGDGSLDTYEGKKRVSNYVIQKTMNFNRYNIKVRLYIARK